MRELLEGVLSGRELAPEEIRRGIAEILDGEAPPASIGALLAGLRVRGETGAEIAALAGELLARAVKVAARVSPLADTCGTGGDGAGTFNVSTAAAFVVAGAGVAVAKHGNRSVSSRCGSSDVLAALGVPHDLDPAAAAACLERHGIVFLFAPRFHPVLARVGPIRRELGVRTIFNLVGPLVNPAPVTARLVGVPAPRYVRPVAEALRELGAGRALVVHGSGMDEIALHGPTQVCEVRDGEFLGYEVTPETFGLPPCGADALRGGDPEENARLLRAVLAGEDTGARRHAALANAAAVLYAAGAAGTLKGGVGLAERSIDSGAALGKLAALSGYRCGEEA